MTDMNLQKWMRIPELPCIPDPLLKITAFTHSSVNDKIGENYERLEFMGDAFLELIVMLILENQYSDLCINTTRCFVLSNKNLSNWSDIYLLNCMILCNPKINSDTKINADLFESYIGALCCTIFDNYGGANIVKWKEVIDWMSNLLPSRIRRKRSKFHIYNSLAKEDREFLFLGLETDVMAKGKTNISHKNMVSIGKSTIKFLISYLVYESNPLLNENQLTHLRSNLYQTNFVGSLLSTLPKYLSTISHPGYSGSKLCEYLIGKYVSADYLDPTRCLKLKKWVLNQIQPYISPTRQRRIWNISSNIQETFDEINHGKGLTIKTSSTMDEKNEIVFVVSVCEQSGTLIFGCSMNSTYEDARRGALVKAFRNPLLKHFSNLTKWQFLFKLYGKNKNDGIDFF